MVEPSLDASCVTNTFYLLVIGACGSVRHRNRHRNHRINGGKAYLLAVNVSFLEQRDNVAPHRGPVMAAENCAGTPAQGEQKAKWAR
jgi:hypothetical protein